MAGVGQPCVVCVWMAQETLVEVQELGLHYHLRYQASWKGTRKQARQREGAKEEKEQQETRHVIQISSYSIILHQ